jgi:Methyltransferase FkbM domain
VTQADDLKKLERNVYSQYGEDGIVEWVFSRIMPRNKTCVEFGAWDGRNLSNTFNLVAHHGWKAVYIEADPGKFPALSKTAAAYPAITPVCSRVTSTGETALDKILERHGVPEEFDILSIDIDGNDYDVWEATVRYRPTLVIVEFNPTFPAEFSYIDRDGRGFIGSSAKAFTALATHKGYGLIGRTTTNLFYLRNDSFVTLGVAPQKVNEVLDVRTACYAFVNYAGEIVLSNKTTARLLRSVTYAQPLKAWTRRIAGAPTFYLLGEAHQDGGTVLKLFRWVAFLLRGGRKKMSQTADGRH